MPHHRHQHANSAAQTHFPPDDEDVAAEDTAEEIVAVAEISPIEEKESHHCEVIHNVANCGTLKPFETGFDCRTGVQCGVCGTEWQWGNPREFRKEQLSNSLVVIPCKCRYCKSMFLHPLPPC